MQVKNTIKKSFKLKNKILVTGAMIISLLLVVFFMLSYVYNASVENCYTELENQVSKVKSDIYLRMTSDREQLKTIANFAGSILENEEMTRIFSSANQNGLTEDDMAVLQSEMTVVFNSFEESGLINNLEILLPGNELITTSGSYNVNGHMSFEEISQKGVYVSKVRPSVIDKNKNVIHNAVPVKAHGKTVAVLMGVIDVESLNDVYKDFLKYEGAHMHLVDGTNGSFILNTVENGVNNMSDIEILSDNRDKYISEVLGGVRGKMSFESGGEGYVFASYDAVPINDWRVIVAMSEETAFKDARSNISIMILLSVLLVFIMVVYILYYYTTEKSRYNISNTASMVRKLLLEFGQRNESLDEALELIAKTAKARSALFVDIDGERYDFTVPGLKEQSLDVKKRVAFTNNLIGYVKDRKREIFAKIVRFNENLKDENPELYALMEEAGMENIVFTAIWDKNDQVGVIGTINSKKVNDTSMLLCDVAMCFLMTMYNRKYLSKTEQAAITDSLTGLTNRMGFNRDVLNIKKREVATLATVYIDVNELHTFNNKYGHLAGDRMLVYVADAIKEAFAGQYIFRWGGDEFIVIAENVSAEELEDKIKSIHSNCLKENYHVSVGYSISEGNADIELLLKESEKRMYEAKARYYQEKSEKAGTEKTPEFHVSHVSTGSADVDAALTVMSLRYQGVYAVSMDKDSARAILIPEEIEELQKYESSFGEALNLYIEKHVSPDYVRAITNFINYDNIKALLSKGIVPKIYYKKFDGTEVCISVHAVDKSNVSETIWVFEKDI